MRPCVAGTNWEGGIRTPTFVCGGFLGPANRGKELFGLVHVADWFAVFSRWARPDGSWRVDARAEQAGLPAVSRHSYSYALSASSRPLCCPRFVLRDRGGVR